MIKEFHWSFNSSDNIKRETEEGKSAVTVEDSSPNELASQIAEGRLHFCHWITILIGKLQIWMPDMSRYLSRCKQITLQPSPGTIHTRNIFYISSFFVVFIHRTDFKWVHNQLDLALRSFFSVDCSQCAVLSVFSWGATEVNIVIQCLRILSVTFSGRLIVWS